MKKQHPYLIENKERFLNDLINCLKIPSISTDSEYDTHTRKCAEHVNKHLKSIGLENTEIIETKGHPLVYGDWCHAKNAPTLLFYGHYDVQPATPEDLWVTPAFEPELREGYLFARGVSDDKGQVYCHLKAIETLLKTEHKLPINIKVLIEGEEEIGSPNLAEKVEDLKDKLKADVVVISDSPMYDENNASICYSLRGLVYTELTAKGPKIDLHSGQHGGVLHNPIQVLCRLIGQLKDEKDRVLVPGFYEDVCIIDEEQLAELAELPFDEQAYAKELGVKALVQDKEFSPNARKWFRPTLDCNGISGGYQGEGAKTIIPSEASVKISLRLVANQDPQKILAHLKKYIHANCPEGIELSFKDHSAAKPVRVKKDSEFVKAAEKAFKSGFNVPVRYHGEGGSIPVVADFKEILGIDTVFMGFNLPDDAIHSPNERFKLEHYYKGIQTVIEFLKECESIKI